MLGMAMTFMTISLKIFVYLDTMIATICHYNIAIIGKSNALRTIQRTAHGVDIGQKRSKLVKHLDPGVAPVSHQDIVLTIHSNTCGGIELTIAFTIGAKAEDEVTIFGEHL